MDCLNRYKEYDIIIEKITKISKNPKVTRKENVIKFVDFKIYSILLRIVLLFNFVLILSLLLYYKVNEFFAFVLFVVLNIYFIYRSIISYNFYIIDIKRKEFLFFKFRRLKYLKEFNCIKGISVKTICHRLFSQHQKILLSEDYEYNLQIIFNDGQEITFGDFKNHQKALEYKNLFLKF